MRLLKKLLLYRSIALPNDNFFLAIHLVSHRKASHTYSNKHSSLFSTSFYLYKWTLFTEKMFKLLANTQSLKLWSCNGTSLPVCKLPHKNTLPICPPPPPFWGLEALYHGGEKQQWEGHATSPNVENIRWRVGGVEGDQLGEGCGACHGGAWCRHDRQVLGRTLLGWKFKSPHWLRGLGLHQIISEQFSLPNLTQLVQDFQAATWSCNQWMGRHPGGISISRVLHGCLNWFTDSSGACLAVTNTKFARQWEKGPFSSARLRACTSCLFWLCLQLVLTLHWNHFFQELVMIQVVRRWKRPLTSMDYSYGIIK